MQEGTCGIKLPYKASIHSVTARTARPCPSYKQDNRTRSSPSSSMHFTHTKPTLWMSIIRLSPFLKPCLSRFCCLYWKFSVFLRLPFIFVMYFRTRHVYEILSVYLHVVYFSFYCATASSGPQRPHYRGSHSHSGHTTLGRTPLEGWSAPRTDTHNTHNRQSSMSPTGFEPTIPASERLQTHALDGTATGIFSPHVCHL